MVFLVLAALYESWSIPFAVLFGVPFGLLGALLGVFIRRMPNDVYFQVGLIVVVGLAAKNAILIVEFANELRAQGLSIREAAVEAARERLRPILMTSFAFILGVVPLLVASGAGAAEQALDRHGRVLRNAVRHDRRNLLRPIVLCRDPDAERARTLQAATCGAASAAADHRGGGRLSMPALLQACTARARRSLVSRGLRDRTELQAPEGRRGTRVARAVEGRGLRAHVLRFARQGNESRRAASLRPRPTRRPVRRRCGVPIGARATNRARSTAQTGLSWAELIKDPVLAGAHRHRGAENRDVRVAIATINGVPGGVRCRRRARSFRRSTATVQCGAREDR